jgi:hypothetical protein
MSIGRSDATLSMAFPKEGFSRPSLDARRLPSASCTLRHWPFVAPTFDGCGLLWATARSSAAQ